MTQIIIALTKYINIILILLYAYFSFKSITKISEENAKRYNALQILCTFFVLTFSYFAMYLAVPQDKFIVFLGAIILYFGGLIIALKNLYPRYNRTLINGMIFLMTVGFSTLTRLNYTKAVRQFVMCIIISVVTMIIPKIIEKAVGFRKLSYLYAIVGICALLLVFIMGSYTYGAKLSIAIGGFSVQPSEFVKISFVMCIAGILANKANFRNVIITSLIAGLHVIILIMCKDLGTALIFAVTLLFVIYIASGKGVYLFGGLLLGSGASYVAYLAFDHVATRVEAFLNPWPLIDNKGYQITQSLFAIATGGNFGMGIYQGMPGTIPVVDEDFIFSAICEEYGALFGIGLILVIISIFMIFIKIGFNCKDNFYKLCVTGFGVLFIFQVFLAIGGTIKFIPSTGVTLPFISYGRSSVVSLITMFFITLGVELRQYDNVKIHKEEVLVMKKRNNYAFRTTVIFSALMIAMSVYLFIFSTWQGESIINNPYNKRYEVISKRIDKGRIYSKDYNILAQTQYDANGNQIRYYPYEELFANVIGRTTNGLSGLEAKYNYDLLEVNTNIIARIYNELNNNKLQGNSIVTTLDVVTQSVAFDALGDNAGAAIVMDVSNGEILSMVSKPTYNPNDTLFLEDSSLENESGILINRVTHGLYTPGSTFKTITMLQYINENPDTYEDYLYNCQGTYSLKGFDMHCSRNAIHGNCNLMRSLAKSCNCSFVNIGKNIDLDELNKLCNKLLFNKDLSLDFECESSISYIGSDMSEFDVAQTVIGQGKTLVTPMHMAMIVSGIANDGVVMAPTLYKATVDPANKILHEYEAEEYATLFTKEQSDILKEYMREVVLNGTASKLKSDEYVAYGKTGTAQVGSEGLANSWFTGFIEKDGKCYAIVVVVENINENTFPAVGIAKEIADAIN